jgi:hypothetical protein
MLGFCGESESTLYSKFKYAALDPDTIILPKHVCHPDTNSWTLLKEN